jgi:hypothetical protein
MGNRYDRDVAKDECDPGALGQLDHFLRDVRYASRSLRKSPAFAATAILTLALGIGANTVIFSALEGAVLAPLPYTQPDRLVMVLLYNRALKYFDLSLLSRFSRLAARRTPVRTDGGI